MKRPCSIFAFVIAISSAAIVCSQDSPAQKTTPKKARIIFLHHSTGECVWNGGVTDWFNRYNDMHKTEYAISERAFPKDAPYGWNNYPYDYWNIWVRHAGDKPFNAEPTLEMLTKDFDVIIFKHCFPVSAIEPDTGSSDINSDEKRTENYKLQYDALKTKLRSFPKTRFIVWTGAALVASETDEAAARRASAFFDWVRKSWDQPGDNIYLWDFRSLETDGGLYLKPEFASGDSHPNESFSRRVAPMFCTRIVDVIAGRGDAASPTGAVPTLAIQAEPKAPADKAVAPTPLPKKPVTSVEPPAAGGSTWTFDDAELAERLRVRWPDAVAYDKDATGHVLKLDFAKAAEEDWGEYGTQRVIASKRPQKNDDVAAFDRLTFRVRSDRKMELVVMLITRPDALSRTDPSYFGFSAYVNIEPGAWQSVSLDLAALELGMEGDKAYETAGKPTRIMKLSEIRFVTNKKNEKASVLVDDIAFVRSRSKSAAVGGTLHD
ncbi:MAG: hypothetical protein H6818_04700 [Phycisphaerales bacterium]|nr:hypothetical protein [Phycisphaerales bacterium]